MIRWVSKRSSVARLLRARDDLGRPVEATGRISAFAIFSAMRDVSIRFIFGGKPPPRVTGFERVGNAIPRKRCGRRSSARGPPDFIYALGFAGFAEGRDALEIVRRRDAERSMGLGSDFEWGDADSGIEGRHHASEAAADYHVDRSFEIAPTRLGPTRGTGLATMTGAAPPVAATPRGSRVRPSSRDRPRVSDLRGPLRWLSRARTRSAPTDTVFVSFDFGTPAEGGGGWNGHSMFC